MSNKTFPFDTDSYIVESYIESARAIIKETKENSASGSDMNTIDLRFLFRCKKPRRSQRLESRDISESKIQAVQLGPLGYFELIPLELKFHIFSFLQVEDLSQVTITSKCMRNLVELYRDSERYQRFILPRPVVHSSLVNFNDHTVICSHFQKLGLLMKRSTCLYSTKDRLRMIHEFLRKYLCINVAVCADPTRCISLLCYGRFLHTVIAGWDDHECAKAFEIVTQVSGMTRNLRTILNSKPGTFPDLELRTRLYYRRGFIGQYDRAVDRAFWLTLVLRPFPMVHQARLLFLLFGPISSDKIQWFEVCESTPSTKDEALICFSELASAYRILYSYNKAWTENTIISLIDEVTSCPDDWLSENVAHLLFLCGDKLTTQVLVSKAINSHIAELCDMIPSLSLICLRHEHPLKWVVNVVKHITAAMDSHKERQQLLNGIVDMFRDILLSIYYVVETDDNAREFQLMLEAQAAFTKEIVQLGFKDLL